MLKQESEAMARDVMTIRLDRVFRSRLLLAAKRRRMTPSAAARAALEGWVEAEGRAADARPYDEIADLIGSVGRGEQGRSTRGREGIVRRARRRASRRSR
jgi:hypothetical protein